MVLPRPWTILAFLLLQATSISVVFRRTTGCLDSVTVSDHKIVGDGTRSTKSKLPFDEYFRELYKYRPLESPTEEQRKKQEDECGPFPYTKFFQQGQKRRSRLKEDITIFETFFQDVPADELKTFKYIEIGGFNGMDESNSRFFETCLKWDGLLVEPNPKPYIELVQNRPHAHRASYAVSCTVEQALANKTVSFHDYIFANAAQTDTENAYTGGKKIDVPCGPIHPVVLETLGPNVHFFSLDVEGAEPMVLSAIDFSAIFIDVLMIEVQNNFCPRNKPCLRRDQTREIMHTNGYHRFEDYISASDVYVHPRSRFLEKILAKRQPTKHGA